MHKYSAWFLDISIMYMYRLVSADIIDILTYTIAQVDIQALYVNVCNNITYYSYFSPISPGEPLIFRSTCSFFTVKIDQEYIIYMERESVEHALISPNTLSKVAD